MKSKELTHAERMRKVNDEGAALSLIKAAMVKPLQAAPDFLLRKGTATSSEVHSPTSTETNADTKGNVTVTGGAGDGDTTVHIHPAGDGEGFQCADCGSLNVKRQVAKGDVAGHKFHGNQYQGGADAQKESVTASLASTHANKTGKISDHRGAAAANFSAAQAQLRAQRNAAAQGDRMNADAHKANADRHLIAYKEHDAKSQKGVGFRG